MTVKDSKESGPGAPGLDAREFGAAGDGRRKDTAAIQAAIDRCASAGGGLVRLPAGTYLCGTIYLKSNVELRLEAGATILGSPDRADYNGDDAFPESPPGSEMNSGAHLVVAYRQSNVAITGPGTIDGNGARFFLPPREEEPVNYRYRRPDLIRTVDRWRPGQMLWFCRCSRITLEGVKLVNPPFWTLLLHACEDARLTGLSCINPPCSRNADGIDIDCSRNVTVSDCILRTGDDCLTLRANTKNLGEEAPACENVAVTNCVLSSPSCAIRIGVGSGVIRGCFLGNIIIRDSRTGININSCYSARGGPGVRIEDLRLSGFEVDCILPIVMTIGPDAKAGAAMQDISFSGFRVRGYSGSQVIGRPGLPVRRARFSDFDWCLGHGGENTAHSDRKPEHFPVRGYPGFNGEPGLPAALYLSETEDCVFENMRFRWEDPGPAWRDGIYAEKSRRLRFRNLELRQPRDDRGAAIRLSETDDILVASCSAAPGTRRFLEIENCPRPESIRRLDNDLYHCAGNEPGNDCPTKRPVRKKP